jgi:prepilin-type N-terminal cleavage/methylation domain-containing protein
MTSRGHTQRPGRSARSARGFTLLEVMLALAILSVTLVGLLGRTVGNVRLTQESALRGTVAALARGQMYQIEDELLREGFQDLDQTMEGDFGEQGWKDIIWEAAIEKVEIPGLEAMKALGGEGGEGGEGGAEGEEQGGGGGGGILGQFLGMGGGTGAEDTSMDAALISSQFEMFRQVLEASIRKVTLTLTWEVGHEEQEMVVVCYFTDPAAMQEVLPGIGGLGGGGAGDEDGTGGGGGDRGGSGPRNPPGSGGGPGPRTPPGGRTP